MASSSIDDRMGKPVRTWYGRKFPVSVAAAILLLLAVGAFLLWGPIGLGNGPVSAAVYATEGSVVSGRGPVGFVIPIQNSGTRLPSLTDWTSSGELTTPLRTCSAWRC